MIARRILLALALPLLVSGAAGRQGAQRVFVYVANCADCSSYPPRVRVSDEAQGGDITPYVSGRSAAGFSLVLDPGFYRLFLSTPRCSGDRYLGVLPHRDRRFDISMTCGKTSTWEPRTLRLVDAMRGLAGTLPKGVTSVSMWPADEPEKPIAATISKGAYYFDEADCSDCVLQTGLTGRSARIGIRLRRTKNFSLVVRDISQAELTAGMAVRGSPFNAPSILVEGPSKSVWILDRLGNRVAAIDSAGRCHEYALPTPFADAGDIVATAHYVWVSERRVGRLVRIAPDGRMREYEVGATGYYRNLRIASGDDGRVWFVHDSHIGAMDAEGVVSTYQLSGQIFWIRDLALGSDGRMWLVGEGSSMAPGQPFLAAIDAGGRSQRFPLTFDASSILAAHGGVWVTGDYDSISFIGFGGHEVPARLPIDRMRPRPYVVDATNTLWFSDAYGNVIARVSPDGSVRATYTDFGPPEISDMRIDQTGDVWIAEPKAHAIEEFGKGFAVPPAGVHPRHLLFDSSGDLWYSDPDADVVGVILRGGRFRCYAFRLSRVKSCAFGRIDILQ